MTSIALTDEQLKELEETGTVAGIFDEINKLDQELMPDRSVSSISTTVISSSAVSASSDGASALYYLTLDDQDNVLELVQDTRDGLSTRVNGAWNLLDPEDDVPSVFDREWVPVTEAAVAFFDSAEQTNQALKRENFVSYYSIE